MPLLSARAWIWTRTYICFLRKPAEFATTTRTATDRVLGSTSAAILSIRPVTVFEPVPTVTSAASPTLIESRSDPNTCVMTQTRERSAMVKLGVVPACRSSPGVMSFSTTVPAIGERIMPAMWLSGRPRRTPRTSRGSAFRAMSACRAASRSDSAPTASVSAWSASRCATPLCARRSLSRSARRRAVRAAEAALR